MPKQRSFTLLRYAVPLPIVYESVNIQVVGPESQKPLPKGGDARDSPGEAAGAKPRPAKASEGSVGGDEPERAAERPSLGMRVAEELSSSAIVKKQGNLKKERTLLES